MVNWIEMRHCLVAALVLSGCFQADPAPPEQTYEERIRGLMEDYYATRCRRALECGPVEDTYLYAHWSCHPAWLDIDAWVADVVDGRWTLDEAGIAECTRIYAEGSGCISDEEPRSCLDFTDPALPEGSPCRGFQEYVCAPGTYCDQGACTCTVSPGVGEPCALGHCAEDAFCDIASNVCRRLGPGGACEASFDCRGYEPLYCIDGVCLEELPTFSAGDRCIEGGCGPDLRCDYREVTSDPICAELGGFGDECWNTSDCDEGLACVEGACGPPLGPGGECWEDEVCVMEAPYCYRRPRSAIGPGIYSPDPEGMRCLPPISPGYDGPFECPDGFVCVGRFVDDYGLEWGACAVGGSGPGDACESAAFCPAGTRCAEGRCVPFVLPTDLCGRNHACPLTHVCDTGACTPRPVLDEPCDADHPCLSGICDGGICVGARVGTPCEYTGLCDGYCSWELDVCLADLPVGAECGRGGSCVAGSWCVFSGDRAVCMADMCI